jgi:pimeloyl-ACP methyl ester carboxylesterase
MKVDLMQVETADGVRLDGALRTPAGGPVGQLGLDLVICHHGVGGNFYNPYFFDDLGSLLLEQGCAVLRVNSRGHDLAYRGPRGKLGAEYEVVDECRLDWRAWLDFAESAGYRRIGVWGHSLGAVKTIYYQSVEHDERVVCAVASSPPRFSYDAYLAAEEGPRFKSDMDRALQLIAASQPEAIVEAAVPLVTSFTARTYVDKYGPDSRYDILTVAPDSAAPLLVTLGELEIDGLAFRDLAERGPSLRAASPRLSYRLIAGADHSYATRVPHLWETFRAWLDEAGVGTAALSQRTS